MFFYSTFMIMLSSCFAVTNSLSKNSSKVVDSLLVDVKPLYGANTYETSDVDTSVWSSNFLMSIFITPPYSENCAPQLGQ